MVINSIADLRELARRRVPRAIFDYADRGSYDEITFNRNLDDLHAIQLRQRVMVDVSKQQVATRILGEDWTIPVGIGPTGLTGLFPRQWRNARSARRAGLRRALLPVAPCRSAPSKTCAAQCKSPSGSRST